MGILHGEHTLEKQRRNWEREKKKKDINSRPRIASNTGEAILKQDHSALLCGGMPRLIHPQSQQIQGIVLGHLQSSKREEFITEDATMNFFLAKMSVLINKYLLYHKLMFWHFRLPLVKIMEAYSLQKFLVPIGCSRNKSLREPR